MKNNVFDSSKIDLITSLLIMRVDMFMSVKPFIPLLPQICALQCTKCKAFLLEPLFCSQILRDTVATHKLIARITFFINLRGEEKKRRREKKMRGAEKEEGAGGGMFFGDAGSGNPGLRPGFQLVLYNCLMINTYYVLISQWKNLNLNF